MQIDPNGIKWDDQPAQPDPVAIKWDTPKRRATDALDKPDPTGTFGQNFDAGVGQFVYKLGAGVKGVMDDFAAGAQSLVDRTPLGPAVQAANRLIGAKTPQQIQAEGRQAEAERRRLDAPLDATWGGKLGNATGALTLGLALPGATVPQAVGAGAGIGLVEPVAADGERAVNAALGAGGAAAGAAVTRGLARVIRPNTAPGVRTLLAEGVTPTPGKVLGGVAARAEDALTSVPLLGDAIRAGQNRAMGEFNRAAVNRALAPVGETLPPNITGRAAVDYVEQQLGQRYNALLPQLTTYADNAFNQQIQSLRQLAGTGPMDPAMVARFERILQNQVLGKFMPGPNGTPTVTGQTMKQIESDLSQLVSGFRGSADPDQRMLGDALRTVREHLREAVQRSNPQAAPALARLDEGWANFKRLQRAASSVAAEDGVFTPAQLQGAVKALDRSKDKGSFARGNALMQDLTDPARQVLGGKVPDSGTAGRLMMGGGLASLGGGAVGAGFIAPQTAIAAALPALAYTPWGQRAAAALFARRPDAAEPLAELVRRAVPGVAAVSASSAAKLQQQ